jgi:hypothetical protein
MLQDGGLACLITLNPWRWRIHAPSQHLLNVSGPHGVMSVDNGAVRVFLTVQCAGHIRNAASHVWTPHAVTPLEADVARTSVYIPVILLQIV